MKFVVLGAGAWGTAFAVHLARVGHEVVLVPRREEQAVKIVAEGINREYLPEIELPSTLRVSADVGEALRRADAVLLACPAQALRSTLERLRNATGGAALPAILSLAKGLEIGTHLRPSEVIQEILPQSRAGALTGPTNALEVARAQPSAMVLAMLATEDPFTREVQLAFSSATLRVYTTDDIAGAEIGGCLKNVYAIAAGCCEGLRLGDNTKAALLTRALAEMVRVGVALGARLETFYGLSGFGDLIATCYGGWSRNREFGEQVGAGHDVATLLANRKTVVEGYKTTDAFANLCAQRGIEAPILREMHAILLEGKKPAAALAALMTRELKRESMAALR